MALFAFSGLHGDSFNEDWGLENIKEPEKQPGPFRIEFEFDAVQKTHFNKEGFSNQKFGYSEFSGSAGTVICYSINNREAYALAVGDTNTNMLWEENPYFSQEHFNEASLLLRFYSNRFCDWVWKGEFASSINTEHPDFNHYLDFDVTVWGRYEYSCDVGIHLGFIVQTGMKLDHVYPIVGFDWNINRNWTLNMAFPVNISLQYEINNNWTSSFGMRFFDGRHRAGNDEPLPMALVSYKNSGIEFAMLYAYDPALEVNFHIGSTLGGMLRIANKQNHHATHFKLDPAMYVGSELVWSF